MVCGESSSDLLGSESSNCYRLTAGDTEWNAISSRKYIESAARFYDDNDVFIFGGRDPDDPTGAVMDYSKLFCSTEPLGTVKKAKLWLKQRTKNS